jgi:hypothetical protein
MILAEMPDLWTATTTCFIPTIVVVMRADTPIKAALQLHRMVALSPRAIRALI